MEQEFETGVRLIRDAFTKKLSTKDGELFQLKADLARKEVDIKALQTQVSGLQTDLQQATDHIVLLNKQLARLAHFKQSVLDSFEYDDFGLLKQKLDNSSFVSQTASPTLSGRPSNTPLVHGEQTSQLHKVSSAKYNSSIAGDILAPNSAFADFSPVKAPSVASTAPKRSQTSEQEKEPLTTASTDINESKTPQQASITNTAASTGTIDGRQFFRQAKSVLSYDEFTNLLWNVKAYNNRDQSRSQTLENVHASIGKKYPELHMEFQSLLANR